MTHALSRRLALFGSLALLGCHPKDADDGDTDQVLDTDVTDTDIAPQGLPIGSACTDASECGGGASPVCLDGVYPLEGVAIIPPNTGLTFVGGYCSFDPNCTTDDDCDPGHGGKCFRPFHASTSDQWAGLETTLGLEPGGLAFLIDYGVCLKSCADESECRDPGYTCELPLDPLMAIVEGLGVTVDSAQAFCVSPSACIGHDCGDGVCDSIDGTNAVCVCPEGFEDDGTTCAPVCDPVCGDHARCEVDDVGDHVCACDEGYEGDGVTCILPACGTPCDPNASFGQTMLGAPSCVCDAGFTGDGATCAAIACSPSCSADATCVASDDGTSASCTCNAGFVGDGLDCTDAFGERYVATTGVDEGDCSSSGAPCLTVNYATGQADAGDVVHVAAGTYPELVLVDRDLIFLGANAGVSAGVGAGVRGAESVVKGFRSAGVPHPAATEVYDVTIDGFRIDPQDDAEILAKVTFDLVSLYGGPKVVVRNNVFDGGPWVPDCGADCTTMTDSALMIQSGVFEVTGNLFEDFRRPVDIGVWDPSPTVQKIQKGTFSGNVITRVSTRGIWLLDRLGGEVTISGNDFDATSYDAISAGVAAIVMTSGGNMVRGNRFAAWSSGVYMQVCDGSNVLGVQDAFLGNTFDGNRSGIQVYVIGDGSGCAPFDLLIRNNDFTSSVKFGVRWNGDAIDSYDPPARLDASLNWWNAPTGPDTLDYLWNPGDPDPDPLADNVTPFVDTSPAYTVSGGCD